MKNNTIPTFWEDTWFITMLSGITGLFVYWVKSIIDQRKNEKREREERKLSDGFRSVMAVGASMDAIYELSNAVDRVFLLEISNHGKKPAPGRSIYARAIDIKIDADANHSREWHLQTFNEVQVDTDYIRMIDEVHTTQKPYIFDVEKHPNCFLKRTYQEIGIKYSEIYHVFADVDQWKHYIISVATVGGPFPEHDRPLIQNNIDQIRTKFKKYRI